MGLHQQVTACRLSGGPLSGHCTCEHCTLSVCSVCLAYEGGLTTDCPGVRLDSVRLREVYETDLDYTDALGWHQGRSPRRPRFTVRTLDQNETRSCGRSLSAARGDSRGRAPIDWATVERTIGLEQALVQKALRWALADRRCDDYSVVLTRLQGEVDARSGEEQGMFLFQRLELARINFLQASHRAEKCDEEFRQAARELAAALASSLASSTDQRPEIADAHRGAEHGG